MTNKTTSTTNHALLNALLAKKLADKVNLLAPCKDDKDSCGCSGSSGPAGEKGMVDLVVLVDSSGSMRNAISAIDGASSQAIKTATESCSADVEAVYLLVDIRKPGSAQYSLGNFATTHQKYLEDKGITGPFFHDQPDNPGSLATEQGADAIADIAKFYPWREGACRTIFYVSDTILEGDGSSVASNDLAVDQAISVANANQVTVFAHRCDPYTGVQFGGIAASDCDPDYIRLANDTGGNAVTGGLPSKDLYVELIALAICDCGKGCLSLDIPELQPCVSVYWGDSNCDGFETDDFESLYIKVCNCYDNVTFSNFFIESISIKDEHGREVAVLPDGTASVQVAPQGALCFGDIEPCEEGEPSCVVREIVVRTRGAKAGNYQLNLEGISYAVSFTYELDTCFKLNICES